MPGARFRCCQASSDCSTRATITPAPSRQIGHAAGRWIGAARMPWAEEWRPPGGSGEPPLSSLWLAGDVEARLAAGAPWVVGHALARVGHRLLRTGPRSRALVVLGLGDAD